MKNLNTKYTKAIMSIFYSLTQSETKKSRELYAQALKSLVDKYLQEREVAEKNHQD